MTDPTATEMDAVEIAEFLDTQDTGVLALAGEDDAYGIPVSFVYKPDESQIYFRFGFAPGSHKRKYLESTDHATFTVYDQTDDGWKSVVASGRPVELSSNDADTNVIQAVEGLRIPYFKVFERPAEDLQFGIVRLDVDGVRGIVEASG